MRIKLIGIIITDKRRDFGRRTLASIGVLKRTIKMVKKMGYTKNSVRGEMNSSCLANTGNDTITGTWYHFGDYGHLMMTFSEFTKNIHSIITGNNKGKYTPDYKCYMTSYYPNGRKKEEGLLLWNEGESPESDFSVEYGEWKYYDENGNLIEVKVFK